MAERTVVSTTGLVSTYGISVKDGENGQVPAKFNFCKDWKSYKAYVTGMSEEGGDESPLAKLFELSIYAADLKARAAARTAVAAESTIVKRDGKEVDIMKIPVKNAVAAINAAYTEVAALGGKPGTAFSASRRKLLEAGKVTEKDGALVLVG